MFKNLNGDIFYFYFLFNLLYISPYISLEQSPTLRHLHTNTCLARIGYLIKCPLKLEMLFCSPW